MTARIRSILVLLCVLALTLAPAGLALAQTPAPAPSAPAPGAPAAPAAPAPPKIDSGDTAWVLVSSALVLLMTAPGLALFYGGMVRQKNALGTLMQSFIILALISVQWVLWGYSPRFGPDKGGIIGGLEWVGLRGVGPEPNADYAATIPHPAFMLFQMMFAVITPALITGAFAERKKFSTFLVFILLWATLRLRPARALGLGHRRLAAEPGRARLRGRHRRAHLVRHLGPRRRARDRQASGLRPRAHAARTTCR